MKIEVNAVNFITKADRQYLSYIELHEPGQPGGEALIMIIEETEDRLIHNRVMGNMLYVSSFNEQQIIKVMQGFIDDLKPDSWQDLQNRLPKEISWV